MKICNLQVAIWLLLHLIFELYYIYSTFFYNLFQIQGVDPDGDRLSYFLVSPTSNLARAHFYVGTNQNGQGQVYVGQSLTQTQTDRFTLSIRATDNSAQPQPSNTLTVYNAFITKYNCYYILFNKYLFDNIKYRMINAIVVSAGELN